MHDVLSNAGITVWSNLKKILSFLNDSIVYNKVDPYVKQLEVKTPSYQQIVSNLSGGNQQKISVAKWLASGTDILFIDEPTVGIDIKTKSYLHELIIDLSLKGTSIILITSDMPEMISLADRIITMKDFKVVGETINNHNYEEMSSSIMGIFMNKRQLGKTDINLTAIGFGGAPLGNLFENLDERNCYDILEKSYKKESIFMIHHLYMVMD